MSLTHFSQVPDFQRERTLAHRQIDRPVKTSSRTSRTSRRLLRVVLALLIAVSVVPTSRLAAEMRLEGDYVQGGLVLGFTVAGTRITADGQAIRVSPGGVFIIGFHRDEVGPVVLEAAYPEGTRERRELVIEPREYRVQRIDGLPKKKVTPDADVMARIGEERALVVAARKRDDERTDFLTGFMWPAQGPITGVYGSQRILNGEPRQPHFGVDIAVPVGTPVLAPADGVVTLVHDDMYFSGGTLILDHGHGLSSAFLHLHRALVQVGDVVKRGEPIAEVGDTGRVTGAHLDWRMNLFERRIDPTLLVGPMN